MAVCGSWIWKYAPADATGSNGRTAVGSNVAAAFGCGNGELVKASKFLPQVYQEMLGRKYDQID